jgi:hypothetical protein
MIINYVKKIIFIKTKKTASTSIEISLSEFCADRCIITPITPRDEETRKTLGFKGPQNYIFRDENSDKPINIYNHIPAAKIRRLFPEEWRNFLKIAVVRNPFDVAISRYFWEGGERTGLNFGDYVAMYPQHLSENSVIAPVTGLDAPDLFIKYENLATDFENAGLGFLLGTLSRVKAKGNIRPSYGSSMYEMFDRFPEAAELVRLNCSSYISHFDYEIYKK